MSSGVFRGKESSNRIELSRLVQDLLNFGVLGSLQLWGGGRLVGVVWGHGVCPPHMHMHAHTHTHVYMYRNCKWPPTWRHPCLACLSCSTYMCMCMHAYVHRTPPRHPYPPPPHLPICHPPRGWTPRISKNSITLELIKIFQFHLKI